MLLILLQYLNYSFPSKFIHKSHTSSHHGLECPCLHSFVFLQMSNTFRILTQNTHERLFSYDINIKLAWAWWWFTELLCMQPFRGWCDIYKEHNYYILPDVDVQIFKSSFKSQWLLRAIIRKSTTPLPISRQCKYERIYIYISFRHQTK